MKLLLLLDPLRLLGTFSIYGEILDVVGCKIIDNISSIRIKISIREYKCKNGRYLIVSEKLERVRDLSRVLILLNSLHHDHIFVTAFLQIFSVKSVLLFLQFLRIFFYLGTGLKCLNTAVSPMDKHISVCCLPKLFP